MGVRIQFASHGVFHAQPQTLENKSVTLPKKPLVLGVSEVCYDSNRALFYRAVSSASSGSQAAPQPAAYVRGSKHTYIYLGESLIQHTVDGFYL
jgi:hypothetical protein